MWLDSAIVSRWRRRTQRAVAHPSPVFVLGHPKSGTTIVAALLSRTSGEEFTDDFFYRAAIPREEVGAFFLNRLPLAALVERYPHCFATRINKSPKLTFFYDQLRSVFPAARFVYVVRDPRSALRSFLGWRRIPGNRETIVNPSDLRRLDVLPAQPEGHYVERLATRWNQAADVYLRHSGELVLVRYEDFLREPEPVVRRTALAAGLVPSFEISQEVFRRYKASGVADVPWLEFFGSRNLARIQETCGERMKRFGYE